METGKKNPAGIGKIRFPAGCNITGDIFINFIYCLTRLTSKGQTT